MAANKTRYLPKLQNSLKLLSLSGGGFKGLYSAKLLADLHERFSNRKIQDTVDVVAGTSVGAIIGAGLAAGKTPRFMAELFDKHGEKLFPDKRWRLRGKNGPGIFKAQYDHDYLRKLLIQELGHDRTFGDLEVPLYVTATDVSTGRALLIGGYPDSCLHFKDTPVWQAVLASTSAPTYFPFRKYKFTEGDIENPLSDGWLADGGLAANSPELFALGYITKEAGVSLDDFLVLSIGTTFVSKRELPKMSILDWGAFNWLIGRRGLLTAVMLQAQSDASIKSCENLMGANNYVRLDSGLPEFEDHPLDDPTVAPELGAQASAELGKILRNSGKYRNRVAVFFSSKP